MMNKIFQSKILQQWLNAYLILLGNEGDQKDLAKKGLTVLEKLEKHNLFIRQEKSEFFITKVDFLGYVINNRKVAMQEQKVSGIADWPPPENITQVRSFIGFCNYYRRFINHYASLCAPLNELLQKTEI
jgi:hypothetical protein